MDVTMCSYKRYINTNRQYTNTKKTKYKIQTHISYRRVSALRPWSVSRAPAPASGACPSPTSHPIPPPLNLGTPPSHPSLPIHPLHHHFIRFLCRPVLYPSATPRPSALLPNQQAPNPRVPINTCVPNSLPSLPNSMRDARPTANQCTPRHAGWWLTCTTPREAPCR